MCAKDFNSAAANTPPIKRRRRRRGGDDSYESEDMYIASLLVALSERGEGPTSSAAEVQNQTEPSTPAAVKQTEYSPSTGHHPSPSQDNCHTCNICGRGFTSYQALGGHTKLSTAAFSNKRKTSTAAVEAGRRNPTNCARIHTCATCGETFPSGQALGGHKRRHTQALSAASASAEEVAVVLLMLTAAAALAAPLPHQETELPVTPPKLRRLPCGGI